MQDTESKNLKKRMLSSKKNFSNPGCHRKLRKPGLITSPINRYLILSVFTCFSPFPLLRDHSQTLIGDRGGAGGGGGGGGGQKPP